MKLAPKTIVIIVLCALPVIALSVWLFREATKPLPGEKVKDLGRNHIQIGTKVDYNSNPPTSGPHYPDWIRAGVYDGPKDDRNLVHSLEHGYIEIHYNCDFGKNNAVSVPNSGPIELATDSAHLSDNFKNDECKNLVAQLTKIYNDEGHNKTIVVPRPNLDAKIALTSWGRIDKWSPNFPLSDQDIAKIKNFLEVLRGHGPEQTME